MRKNYYFLLMVLSALLSGVIIMSIGLSVQSDNNIGDSIDLEITNSGISETISVWQNSDENIFIFLPSYAKKEHVIWKIKTQKNILIDNVEIRSGENLTDFEFDKDYIISIGNKQHTLRILQSAKLPTMYINTKSGSTDNLELDKNNKESGWISLIDQDGTIEYRGKLEWISGRGNHSWTLDKKGWTIKLPKSLSLLGMSESKKWILFANAFDDSGGLRNYIAYNMALSMGLQYSSEIRFIDLYMNDVFAGTYQLVEKIENDANHLDIGTVNSTDNSGGYILERNYGYKLIDKSNYFITNQNDGFVIRSPENLSNSDYEYISAQTNKVESILFSESYSNADGLTLEDVIDLQSWTDKYLVDEITKNEGAGSTSSYFYKKKYDDLLYAGPVWDYDKSLGRVTIWQDAEGLFYSKMHSEFTEWWERLYYYDKANIMIKSKYTDMYRPYIMLVINKYLDEWSETITESYKMDRIRWNEFYNTYIYTCPESIQNNYGSLQNSVEYLKCWLNDRIDFLDKEWIDGQHFYTVRIKETDGQLKCFCLEAGSLLETNTDIKLYDESTNMLFDYTQPVFEDKKLYVKNDPNTDNTEGEIIISDEKTSNVFIAFISRHKQIIFAFTIIGIGGFFGLCFLISDIKRFRTGGDSR